MRIIINIQNNFKISEKDVRGNIPVAEDKEKEAGPFRASKRLSVFSRTVRFTDLKTTNGWIMTRNGCSGHYR